MPVPDVDMLPEYDFTDGKRGKYADRVPLWFEFVDPIKDLCGLCGNAGIIDTRGKIFSAAGVECGVLRFCICPNGRGWKIGRAHV